MICEVRQPMTDILGYRLSGTSVKAVSFVQFA